MRRDLPYVSVLSAVALLALQGCDHPRAPTEPEAGEMLTASAASAEQDGRYLVLFSSEQVPADFADRVTRRGGTVEASLDRIGVAAVIGLNENAADLLADEPGIRNLEPDPVMAAMSDPAEPDDASGEPGGSEVLTPATATALPSSAFFYPRQWNMRAVFADQAWGAGHLGSRDVVVAILDTGIDYLHPDLVGLVDLERSKSFVPEEDPAMAARGRLPFGDLFWHGTAAASIVASNAKVVAGINRDLTLIAVKIADSTSAGPLSRVLEGIVYAADQGADVINVSRSYVREKSKSPGSVAATERAVNYAFRKGALVVSIAGNDAADLDHDGDEVRLPCEAANALCASATGPIGAAGVNGPWTDVDAPAPYSAYGRSAIGVAAPGGAGDPGQFRRVWLPCTATWTQATTPNACRTNSVPVDRRIAQGLGTSWSAPHTAGLAALLVAQVGHRNPALIRARILQSADDLGELGTDPYYGKGRINIARALGLID